ncbi:MAG: hypothetical protein SLAVMIC_00522 [uncultured marine phage]|uniref:Uncharacterized protein n=1 Tax=uncultured marine phage TaxID=707152 RepID=A0A8D9FQU8_9VIRU|nr:MAG: hypothetical protein SLAVMIC_00522 [uncultured marine phage]
MNSNKELKTSEEWIKLKNQENYPISILILEDNGWEDNWEEPISKIEFDLRLAKSKVMYQNSHTDSDETNFHDHIPGRD